MIKTFAYYYKGRSGKLLYIIQKNYETKQERLLYGSYNNNNDWVDSSALYLEEDRKGNTSLEIFQIRADEIEELVFLEQV